eukprot:scaffold624_cov402-Prasinococcus_capsulatus_cf.AAC.17
MGDSVHPQRGIFVLDTGCGARPAPSSLSVGGTDLGRDSKRVADEPGLAAEHAPQVAVASGSAGSPGQRAQMGSVSEIGGSSLQQPEADAIAGEHGLLGLSRWEKQREGWRQRTEEQQRVHNQKLADRRNVISPDATYQDILSTGQPFPKPVTLREMVDFLVEVWEEDGLYG